MDHLSPMRWLFGYEMASIFANQFFYTNMDGMECGICNLCHVSLTIEKNIWDGNDVYKYPNDMLLQAHMVFDIWHIIP